MTLNTTSRAGIAGAAALLTLVGTSSGADAATAPGDAASAYVAGQLAADGNHLSVTFDGETYADNGLTIDAVLGLSAAGVAGSQVSKSAAWLAANSAFYTGSSVEGYAGATAKQIVMLQATGGSTSALLTQLKGFEQPSGRFSDKSEWGDYSNTIGQSWALIALKRSGGAVSTKAIDFLAAQQCSDGGFRLELGASTCVSDPDATSMAIQALAANGRSAVVTKAGDYLAGQQVASGGVRGGASTTSPNTNSAGLAAVAFSLAGKPANATRAAAFVQSLQFGCSAPAALRGAIAYDKSSFDAQVAAGASAKPSDKENRATPQAMLAFSLKPYLTITAGGSAGVPAIDCATTPTSTPTPTSTTSTTANPSTTSTVSGPPVVTDGPTGSGENLSLLVGAGAVFASMGAGAVALGRRLR